MPLSGMIISRSCGWANSFPSSPSLYTLTVTDAGGAELFIKPTTSGTWTTVVNDWTIQSATTVNTGTFSFVAGATYNVKLQYVHTVGTPTDNAVIKLHWSSPSTPDEAIEPAVQLGVNGATAVDYDPGEMFADAMKMARLGQAVTGQGAGFQRLAHGRRQFPAVRRTERQHQRRMDHDLHRQGDGRFDWGFDLGPHQYL